MRGEIKELPGKIKAVKIFRKLPEIVYARKCRLVPVKHLGSKTHLGGLPVALYIEICGPGSVHGDENIGNDPSSAIDRPALDRIIHLARIHLDAVCIGHLPVPVAFIDVIGIFRPVRIRLLDAASRRGVEPCDSEPDAGAVSEIYRLLHKPLAERTASDDDPPVIVLHRPGENLAGRGGCLVYKHSEPDVLQAAPAVRIEILAGTVEPLHIYYLGILREKLIAQEESLVKIAPCILPYIEYEPCHTL